MDKLFFSSQEIVSYLENSFYFELCVLLKKYLDPGCQGKTDPGWTKLICYTCTNSNNAYNDVNKSKEGRRNASGKLRQFYDRLKLSACLFLAEIIQCYFVATKEAVNYWMQFVSISKTKLNILIWLTTRCSLKLYTQLCLQERYELVYSFIVLQKHLLFFNTVCLNICVIKTSLFFVFLNFYCRKTISGF